MNAWIGHPYYDLIDNSVDFETKLNRVVAAVKKRLQIDDMRGGNLFKRKFLLSGDPLVIFTLTYSYRFFLFFDFIPSIYHLSLLNFIDCYLLSI